MSTEAQYCPHCWPIKRTSHAPMFVSYYMNKVTDFFTAPFQTLRKLFKRSVPTGNPNLAWNLMLEAFSWIGLARYEKNPPADALHPRSSMFFEEAKIRGIDIATAKFLGRYSNDFRFRHNGRTYYYESNPLTMWPTSFVMDNKIEAKNLLSRHGIPVAEGRAFIDPEEGFEYGKQLGYELVVKPNNGSLSNHVTCYIKSDEELREAIQVAKQYSPAFVVERAIPGLVYRGTVVGKSHVFVCLRDRANIVGDGTHTIKELLYLKNVAENRADVSTPNASVYEVPVDEITLAYLAAMGQSMGYIPQAGEKIYLYSDKKYVPDRGNDIINYTATAHPENIQHFLNIAQILDTELVGIDFMCTDITKPYTEQLTAVLETNSLPFIDMHQFPSHGEGDPVAKLTWDFVLERLA